MRILCLADEECLSLWDYYRPGMLDDIDLIISCGDLEPDYLSFLVTMHRAPVLYVCGNHDAKYLKHEPEGCDCIDDKIVTIGGINIMGLGGCARYRPGPFQFTEREMRMRVLKMLPQILWKRKKVDLIITHAAPKGCGDLEDYPHRGFEVFNKLMDWLQPKYLVHGHIHLTYSYDIPRQEKYGNTIVLNAFRRFVIDIEP